MDDAPHLMLVQDLWHTNWAGIVADLTQHVMRRNTELEDMVRTLEADNERLQALIDELLAHMKET